MSTVTPPSLRQAARSVAARTTNARCEDHRVFDPDDAIGNRGARDCDACVRFTSYVIELALESLGISVVPGPDDDPFA